jgi:hypothetical protein
MDVLRGAIYAIADEIREDRTITLRQLYYALTVRGILGKTEADYKRLAHITSAMRRSGVMPYDWIEDGTRITYVPSTWASPQHALENLAAQYSESPWPGVEVVPEIWLEKDALAGIVYDITSDYYVPLRVQRGYASLSALYRAAKDIHARHERYGSHTQVYYLRDLDPSGADAARAAEWTVVQMLSDMRSPATSNGVRFDILGVTEQQVEEWNLPTRPNKATDSRTASFGYRDSIELDAIPPQTLRELVSDAIRAHLSEAALATHEAGVDSTRRFLRALAEATPS